ncbi:MAG TPA: hypothetical protein VMM18_02115 [Gemmatimonadaceae bacterium]|nr:hypothetical protein [Gemmatimonadaceae bacterium]
MTSVAPSPSLPKFLGQEPSSGLCAFHALNHFMGGTLTLPAFMSQATTFYQKRLGMERVDAKTLTDGGNDPALVAELLTGLAEQTTRSLTATDLDYYKKILIPLKNRAHFITILKGDGGTWWNYDSLLGQPAKLDNPASFLTQNPAQSYFLAK